MKRTLITLIAVATLAPAGVALADSSAHAASGTTVQLRHTSLGKILVDRQGFTLYMFTADGSKRDKCMSISGCVRVWPVLKTSAKPVAGSGVKSSLLGTITISGGAKQVTYAGHPLYTYVGDSGPGETDYVGAKQFGGFWYAVNASGNAVK
jgi:predicted lipoprotein with Yx(FWY)xxD motif